MIGHLYRYPHPTEAGKFLYVGQGLKRDSRHRSRESSFGQRFKKQFPNIELPQPIREVVEVENQLELNELETIWMFRYHTWRGYEGGMNLTFPGSLDYKVMGEIGGSITGRKNVESGQLDSIRTFENCSKGGRVAGRKAVESGHMQRMLGLPQTKAARSIQGRKQGRKNVESGYIQELGRVQGRKNVESGLLARFQSLAGTIGGRISGPTRGRENVESGQIYTIATLESREKGGHITGRKNAESGHISALGRACGPTNARTVNCLRWNIRRGKLCICGKHQLQIEDSCNHPNQIN